MIISVLIFSISMFGILNILNKNLFKEEMLETYIYSGLWKSKGNYLKYSKFRFTIYYSQSDLTISKLLETNNLFSITDLRIVPFKWVNGGNFGGVTIEPITFEVNTK
ncbi:hypothetical protein SAMN02745199_1038 [Thermosipho atlanticus DSM 15807]|uniref:Uncharacterized protein n=2 Tax=Thermosipho TaxID=2420 RepID=A0A1M5SRN7_9BACT|nr:hypothetical protein SAMN02745199_1038 [Thermosipho atlanticus DSM 15807]